MSNKKNRIDPLTNAVFFIAACATGHFARSAWITSILHHFFHSIHPFTFHLHQVDTRRQTGKIKGQ